MPSPSLQYFLPGTWTHIRHQCLVSAIAAASALSAVTTHAADLLVRSAVALPPPPHERMLPDQLPHSRIAYGAADVARAWLAGATDRYPHAVLGDRIEASRLMVETRAGSTLEYELPPNRVFEDLEARIVDLDRDGHEEIIVVESDAELGASLAVFSIADGHLVRVAATDFIGQRNRWLNPLGFGDFDGDGELDIAVVATPHIGGVLRLYRYTPPRLTPFAELRDVSTHAIGSTELGLGQVISGLQRDRMLVPDQSRRSLKLLEWSPQGWQVIAASDLPARIVSSLVPQIDRRWRFRLDDGEYAEVEVPR